MGQVKKRGETVVNRDLDPKLWAMECFRELFNMVCKKSLLSPAG